MEYNIIQRKCTVESIAIVSLIHLHEPLVFKVNTEDCCLPLEFSLFNYIFYLFKHMMHFEYFITENCRVTLTKAMTV